jgi:hypothetical protein
MYCSVHSGFIIALAECKTTLLSERFCSVFKEQIRAILRGCRLRIPVIFALPDIALGGVRCEVVPCQVHTSHPAARRR